MGLGAFAAGAVIGSALASPYYGYAPAYSYGHAPAYSYGYAPGYNYGYRRAYYGYAPSYNYGYAPGYNYGYGRASKWSRLSEQDFRFDRWGICRG